MTTAEMLLRAIIKLIEKADSLEELREAVKYIMDEHDNKK